MNIEPEAERARVEIGRIARAILDGKLSFIEGSRSIWRLGIEARLPDLERSLRLIARPTLCQ
jgi:hypothetical protein